MLRRKNAMVTNTKKMTMHAMTNTSFFIAAKIQRAVVPTTSVVHKRKRLGGETKAVNSG